MKIATMKRCQHLNSQIGEEISGMLYLVFVDGKPEDGGVAPECPTGVIHFKCYDCGRNIWFGRRAKHPAWLKKLKEAVHELRGEV